MKIGIFTDVYFPSINGVTVSIKQLKDALEAMGHVVYIVAPNVSSRYRLIYNNQELYLPKVKSNIYSYEDYTMANRFIPKATKIIKSWDLDIIHVHTEFSVGMLGRRFAHNHKIPLVYTYHTNYEMQLDDIFKQMSIVIKLVYRPWLKYMSSKYIHEVIVPTIKAKRYLKEKIKCKTHINVIPTGIDINKFNKDNLDISLINKLKKKYRIRDNDLVLLYVGRLGSEKNIEELITGLALLPDKHIKLCLVGFGPYKKELVTIAKKLGVERRLIFTGKVAWEKTPAFYQLGDVLVSASRYETQGLTIIEGLAASLPVVCVRDQAFRKMVKPGVNGYLYKDLEDFTEIILKLKHNKILYQRIKKLTVTSISNYSNMIYAKRVIRVYKNAYLKSKYRIKKQLS